MKLIYSLIITLSLNAQVPIIVDTIPSANQAKINVIYQWRQAFIANVCPNNGVSSQGGLTTAYCITLDGVNWLTWNTPGNSINQSNTTANCLVTYNSPTVLTIGANASDSTPCNIRFGIAVTPLTVPQTVTVTSGTGNVYI